MISFPQSFDALIPLAVEFFLVAARIGFLFITMPILSSRSIPARIQGALLVTVTVAVMSASIDISGLPMDPVGILTSLVGEAGIGAAAGLCAHIMLAAVETGGQLLGTPMGLGFSGAVDPSSGGNMIITSRFLSLIATMAILVLNIHHILLAMVVRSFTLVPPGKATLSFASAHQLVAGAAFIFSGAVQLAAPVLLVILGVMVTVGLLSRVAPKMNLLVLSFGISIGLGLLSLRAALPDMTAWIRGTMLRIEPFALEIVEGFIKG